MILRGIDRAHDVDLGPSGYHPRRHHFEQLGGMLTELDSHRASARARDLAQRRRKRAMAPRCGYVMPAFGDVCDRPDGHGSKHRSNLDPDHRTADRDVMR